MHPIESVPGSLNDVRKTALYVRVTYHFKMRRMFFKQISLLVSSEIRNKTKINNVQ